MKLEFDEEAHRYTVDGREVPGVTSILKAVGLSKDFSGVETFYRDRGIAVHACIELFLKGVLDEKSIDPVLVPYWEGFKRYWDKHSEKPVLIEVPQYSEEYDFAGTADLVTATGILDWKVSKSHDPVAELQGEGLKILQGPPFLPFRVVQFAGDGGFKIFDYGEKISTFPAVVVCYRWWRKAHPRTKLSEAA
jgi:hypothetical protein